VAAVPTDQEFAGTTRPAPGPKETRTIPAIRSGKPPSARARCTAHLPQLIADWSPELDAKLTGYGTAQGLSREEMAQATLQNPAFVKLLHKAHQHDDTVRKKNTQQTFDAAQAAAR